jgi:hypothetical protein
MAKKRSPKEYEQLGRMLENIYESGYTDRNQAYKTSFIKGILSGLGGVIGATILIALLLWILTLFKQVPLVGPFFDRVRTTVQNEH